jgi:tRNA-specific 2-thiouridylase
VAHKDLAHNTLHVVQGHAHPWLQSPWLEAEDLSWVAGEPPCAAAPGQAVRLAAKTRYRQADAPCRFQAVPGGLRLEFDEPQWAVTPGQSAVLYDGDVCLGGGVIARCALPPVVPAVRPLRRPAADTRRRQADKGTLSA